MPRKPAPLPALAALAALALATAGHSQAQAGKSALGPRSFFPIEYTLAEFVDVTQLLDSPLGDALERSIAGATLRRNFRKAFGFRFESLTRWTRGSRWRTDSEGETQRLSVEVLEGKSVRLPKVRDGSETTRPRAQSKVGAYEVCVESSSNPDALFVVPRPGCLVYGPAAYLRPILVGTARGGVPTGSLLPLMPRTRPLGYFAVQFSSPDHSRYRRELEGFLDLLSDEDPLRALTLVGTLTPKSEALTLRATFRFASGKSGPKKLETGLKKRVQGMFGGAQLSQYYLDKLRYQRQKKDLQVTLVLQPEDVMPVLGPRGMVMMAFAPDHWVAPGGREMGPAQRAGAMRTTLRAAARARERKERKRAAAQKKAEAAKKKAP